MFASYIVFDWVKIYIYIYIYRERERERERSIYRETLSGTLLSKNTQLKPRLVLLEPCLLYRDYL